MDSGQWMMMYDIINNCALAIGYSSHCTPIHKKKINIVITRSSTNRRSEIMMAPPPTNNI